jgi:hypothetical protein
VSKTPRPGGSLTVETDLDLSIGDAQVDVRSTGDRLFLNFPSLRALSEAKRGLPPTGIEGVSEVVAAFDLTTEIRARDRTIFVIEPGAPVGPLSRWVGTSPVQLRALGLLAVVAKEIEGGIRVVRNLLR